MSSTSARFSHTKPSQRGAVNSAYIGHQSTAECQECRRLMVPRVVSYYGQPLKSICPFCGSTFAKFPSGFRRRIEGGYSDILSFSVFNKLATISICFVILWFIADWAKLSDNISLLATFGTAFFLVMSLAELVFQGIERMAAKFCHQSNYYWAALVLVAMQITHEFPTQAGYVALFFFVIIARGIIATLIRASKKPRKSTS